MRVEVGEVTARHGARDLGLTDGREGEGVPVVEHGGQLGRLDGAGRRVCDGGERYYGFLDGKVMSSNGGAGLRRGDDG